MAQKTGIYLFLLLFYQGRKDLSWPGGNVAATCQRNLSKCFLLTSVENERDRGKLGIEKKDGLLPGEIGIALSKTFLMMTSSEASTGSK